MSAAGSDRPPARGNLLVGLVAGIVVGLVVVALAWVVVSGGRGVPASSPSPSRASASSAKPSAKPSATATATQEPSTPAAPPTTYAPPANVTTSLPAGSFVLVLDSLSKASSTPDAAVQSAAALSTAQYPVIVVDSDAVPGFNPGYYALVVANFSSREQATAVCPAFGRTTGGTCYPRQIGG